MSQLKPVTIVPRTAWRRGLSSAGERAVPEEAAVSFTYNRSSHAVMMATPADLEDFAVGFSLTEGIVQNPDEIEEIEIVLHKTGIEARMWLPDSRFGALSERKRVLAGPSGCGLCGLDSLDAAMRQPRRVSDDSHFSPDAVARALDSLYPAQILNRETSALHAAAFWHPAQGLVALREDIGRHNALDKLVGAVARRKAAVAGGMLLLTSRVSVEMVQKAAVLGASVLVAVSAPSALALRTAEAADITLVAIARGDGFEVFTHSHRIEPGAATHVA
jgi:FdhD protein